MLLHGATRRELLVAQVAPIGFFTSMRSDVYGKQSGSPELLLAMHAHEYLLGLQLSGVRAQVATQVVLATEDFIAYLLQTIYKMRTCYSVVRWGG